MQPSQAPVETSLPSSRPEPTGWAHWLALGMLLVASIAVRVPCLACKPFWFDESFSVEVARIDWRNFLRLLWWREANMSLYYVLLRGWLHFGHSPAFIRGLSVAISVATLPAIYWLARLLYHRRVALIATALFTFNIYDIRYAQEARSYALFVLLATLSSAFLISWVRKPSRKAWRGFVLSSVLAAYAHFYALLLVVAQWIVLRWAGIPDRRTATPESAKPQLRRAWITISIAVLPLLIFVAKTGAGPIKWIQRPGLRDLLDFYEHLAGSDTWFPPAIYAVACIAAVFPLRKSLLARNQSWEVWRCQFLLVWLLFPVALTVVLSFARPVFLPRYMIFCLPPLLILVAAGLSRIRSAGFLAFSLWIVLILTAVPIPFFYHHDFDDERDASGAATDFILDHARPGDAILFHIAETRVPYEFFRSLRVGTNSASPLFTEQVGPDILFPHHGPGLDYRDFTGKPTADFIRTSVPSYPRVWVMLMNNGPAGNPDPTTMMLSQILPEYFPKVRSWEAARVEIRLYSKE